MKSVAAYVLREVVLFIGISLAIILIVVSICIFFGIGINREVLKRNRRISRLAEKYNRKENSEGERQELKLLYRKELVIETFFVREGRFFHRYDLSPRASAQVFQK